MVFPSRLAWLMHHADPVAVGTIETPVDFGEVIMLVEEEIEEHPCIVWHFMKKNSMRLKTG